MAARREQERVALGELAASLEALERQSVPPPASSWQRADHGPVLAELVDFQETPGTDELAGVEGAMEAAGLLAAALADDGAFVLPAGTLVVRHGAAVRDPLSRLLRMDVPEGVGVHVGAAAIDRLLDLISTDPAPLAQRGEPDAAREPVASKDDAATTTVVTVDGGFRIGSLRGRYRKTVSEHIGAAPRSSASAPRSGSGATTLRRYGASGGHRLEPRSDAARVEEVAALRSVVPPSEPVLQASIRVELAEVGRDRARAREAGCLAAFRRADELHAEAVDKSRRLAASLRLAGGAAELLGIEGALRDALGAVTQVEDRAALARSVGTWSCAAADWRRAADDERHAVDAYTEAVARHEPQAARLVTLEDTVGAAVEEVVAAAALCEEELARVLVELESARRAQLDRRGEVESAKARVHACERRCAEADAWAVASLPVLRRVLAAPGLLDAALARRAGADGDPLDAVLVPVVETPQGVGALVRRIRSFVPPATRAEAGADGVRQSLRQRRADLGAGWDAEDRQADESVPLVKSWIAPAASERTQMRGPSGSPFSGRASSGKEAGARSRTRMSHLAWILVTAPSS